MSSYHQDLKEYYRSNSFIAHGVDGAHGFGTSPYTDAFWTVMNTVMRRGLDAARRFPQVVPT